MSGMYGPVRGGHSLAATVWAALLHQELLALLILVALAAAWIVVREMRPALALRGRQRARQQAQSPEPAGRRLMRIGFGALWAFDGLLQVQPAMAASAPGRVIGPAAAGSPGWVRALSGWAGRLWAQHPVQASTALVWVQLGLGIWLLTARSGLWSRLAGAASAGCGLAIWVFGEAFGGLLAPAPSVLTGAPGAALLYCAAGILLALPGRHWAGPALGRRLLAGVGLVLLAVTAGTAGFAGQHGFILNAGSALTVAAIGLGLLLQDRRLLRPVVILASIASLADWVLVQDLGILGGVGTDPNSMIPLMLLVVSGYLALTRPAPSAETVTAAHQARPRPRLMAAFAGLGPRGLLAIWAATLVPLAAFR